MIKGKKGPKGSTMERMGNIFTGRVMDEAIKDKEKQFQEEMEEMANRGKHAYDDLEEVKVDEYGAEEKVRKDSLDSDEDFNLDEEGDKILEGIKAKRLKEIKQEAKETIENKAKGHGQYTEITQDEFLPVVTGSKRVV